MVTINISTPLFGTGYYTENHHTEATTLTPEELAAAKVDRFFIELDNDPANATAIIGTGTMTFTDTGPVANNATMDVNPDYDFANVSSAHLEQVVGDMWGVPGQDMTLHDGTDIDFVWNIRLYGLRFDGYQGISDGTAVMGYMVQVVENDTSPIRYFFFPTADQDLSNMVLPAPGEPVPSNVSKLTHQDAFDGNPSSPFGPNWDYDEITGGTYISYIDLMPAPGSGTDYIVEGTSGGDLIDGTYTGDPTGDKVDNNDGNPLSPGVGDSDSIVAGAGNDTVYSGAGDDTVDGGTGNDLIDGGVGNDSLDGGDGADTIIGGAGADTINGGAGDDDIYIGAGDVASGGTGDDEFLIDAANIAGGVITVDGGSDATDGFPDGSENGDNGDTLNLSGATSGAEIILTANPETGTVNGLDGDNAVDINFSEIENIVGTDFADTVDGSAATSTISIDTGAGADNVITGSGDDIIDLGAGADTVDAGKGDDSVDFGVRDGETDIAVLHTGDGNDTIKGFESPIDNGDGTFTGQDQLDVTDMLVPSTGKPVVTTDVTITPDGNGNTTINFPDGSSVQILGAVAPTTDPTDPATESWLNAIGIPSPLNYIVEGTSGADLIDGSYTGDPQGDMIDNGDGNPNTPDVGNSDSIVAGEGDDTVLAGDGDDTIVMEDNFGNDTIDGGESGETGGDILDASAVTTDLVLDLSVGEAADVDDRDLGGDLTFGGFKVFKLDMTLSVSDITDGTIYDAGNDSFMANETSTGLESYSNLAGQTNASLTLSSGDVFTEFGQIVYGTVDINGTTYAGYYVEAYVNGTSQFFFIPDRDENTSEIQVGDQTMPIDLGQSTTMYYQDITSQSNPESGTLTDGTSTATFTEIEEVILGSGNDKVIGSTGNDSVSTGAGADTVDGGEGDDSFDLGGTDGVRDEVVLENGDGHDTITGVEGPIDNGDGTYTAQDQLNVTNLLVPSTGDPVVTTDTTITPDGNGNVTLTFPDATSVTLIGTVPPTTDPTDPATENWLNAIGIPSAPDYIVTGTSGGDLIDGSYTGDPDGDLIDNGDGNPLTPGVGDNDSVVEGAGNDTIYSGLGDDTVDAGTGDDSIFGGAGNDSLLGKEGDDVIDGGIGNDTIYGGEGSDTVSGGDGDDYINTRTSPGLGAPDLGLVHPLDPAYSYTADTDPNNDRDSVDGGAGNDTILTGDDADTIDGGSGNDVIDAGFDADTVFGGAGADSIQGSEGADTIDGGDDDDVIYGGVSPLDPNYAIAQVYDLTDDIDPDPTNNADLLMGGAGNDRIYGQDDADTLQGGTGDDTLDGGIDDDVLEGGAGADVLTGGQGDDTFIYAAGEGADTITDFGAGISGPIDDGDQTNNDFIDLAGFYNLATLTSVNALIAGTGGHVFATELGMLRADAADGVIDGIINGVDYSAQIGDINLTIQNGGTAVDGSALTFDTTNVMCFAQGTMIRTIDGQTAIEALEQGDLVWTKDYGYQPIRWIGKRYFDDAALMANPHIRPILIRAGALGSNVPERDLRVSPQHRMMVKSKIAERLFGAQEVLIAAKHLLKVDGIDVDTTTDSVTYYHFLFDRHQIVEAQGAESESLFTGPTALEIVDEQGRQEILEIFPELMTMDYDAAPRAVRPMLTGRQGRRLTQRHLQKRKHLAL